MVIRKPGVGRRRGISTVETGAVLVLLLSLVLGVFEFSRLLMAWDLLNNAAREGCRYAIANNTNSAVVATVGTTVTSYMAGQDTCFSNFTVTVTGTHLGVTTPIANLTAGDLVTVTVSGNYKFMNIVPIMKMPTSLSIRSSVIMGCEGGV
jgi:Flp pilus assembly protein TadG